MTRIGGYGIVRRMGNQIRFPLVGVRFGAHHTIDGAALSAHGVDAGDRREPQHVIE
ncbi:MAG TPA: hypothetical protein VE673_15675 [Pseudonocardiaceae bacterium]|nr:hypothetical protein [Pseudonocardiaceae bacterium]